jgi:hypothetical protein
MPKPLRVAGEVDSWCTRCRLILNHRIVSMKSGKAHQVECMTCRAQHLWRAGSPGDKPAPAGSPARTRSPAAGGSKASARAQAARSLEQRWEEATLGRSVLDFKPYELAGSFQEGELVKHKKFGDGVVTRVIDGHKVEVLFRDEARTLAQGLR